MVKKNISINQIMDDIGDFLCDLYGCDGCDYSYYTGTISLEIENKEFVKIGRASCRERV